MADVIRITLLALVVGVVTAVVAFYWQQATSEGDRGLVLVDSIQSGVRMGGDFILVNQRGESVDQTSLLGKYSLIYFGFTFCPDVCPVSLLVMMNAYEQLPPSVQQQVQPVFVSVDPGRDTPEQIARYVKDFHPALQGWGGSEPQVERIKSLYRVYAEIVGSEEERKSNRYLITHSSMFYLINPEGELQVMFDDAINSEDLSQNIQKIVNH